MKKLTATLQLLAATILALATLATLINLVFITTRPETISVVNTLIGQGVLIVCMSALANILFRKGWRGFRASGEDSPKDKTANTGSE